MVKEIFSLDYDTSILLVDEWFERGLSSVIRLLIREMYTSWNRMIDPMIIESILLRFHWLIEFRLDYIFSVFSCIKTVVVDEEV